MAVSKTTIGQLRLVGHFENNTYMQPYTAGYVDGYSNIVTSVYCKLRQRNTKRINEFGQVEIVSSWKMICRFQSALENNLLEDTKFVQAGRRFTIVGYEVIDAKDFYYEFTLNLITA
jgi:hypothetical protein